MITSILLQPRTIEESAQGGVLLVQRARDFVAKMLQGGPMEGPLPTIATSRQAFAPVLLHALLAAYPESRQVMLRVSSPLQKAASIAEVLEDLRTGDIPHPVA